MKAVTLLSGGMDSTTLVYYLRNEGYDVHALSIYYGQRHIKELDYARQMCDRIHVRRNEIDLSDVGRLLSKSGSALVDNRVEMPEGHYSEASMSQTVVPNRNMMLLSIATAVAVAGGADIVAAAVHAGDHAIYPDCRPMFIEAMNEAATVATEGFWMGSIVAPFVDKTKAEIAALGAELHVPWELTWSCYKGGQHHCGKCGTCVERQEAFHIAGVVDPTTYLDPEYWKQAVANK